METYIIIGLLAVIALSEIAHIYLTHRKVTKKMHFQQKLEGTKKMLYDLEFKRFKTQELREGIRVEYDSMKQRVAGYAEQIKNWPKDGKEDELKRLEDQKVLAERDVKNLEGQIAGLDLEVNGSKPTNQYPEGVTGVNQQIDSMRELNEMLRDWIKSL